MPHLTFEYTPIFRTDWKALFAKLHPVLKEMTGTPSIANCKSRAYCTDNYLVGDTPGVGFLHLEIAILEGKTAEEKKAIGAKVREILVEHLGDAAKGRPITIEVRDIQKDFYFKHLG